MPVVRVSDATFADLSALRTWFGTKTPGDTIDHVVRAAMEELGMERDNETEEVVVSTSSGAMHFESAPGLSFTKPLSASVNGKAIASPRWSSILMTMIGQLKRNGLEGERLVKELGVPAKVGRFEDEGFKHSAELGISVQGQSATEAWKEIDRIARKWKIPVSVEFWWRQNPKAQHPGRTGLLKSGGA